MIQPWGMVLEGRVAIGHGGVAGVAGLGEEAEIRETQAADQENAGSALLCPSSSLGPGMQKHAEEED